ELILGTEFLAMMARAQEVTTLFCRGKTEEAILIRCDLRLWNAIAIVVEIPRHHLSFLERFARRRIQHEALDFSVALPNHERQVTHPNVCERDLIISLGEVRIMAGDQKIKAGLKIVGRRQFFSPFFEVWRRW